MSWTEERIERLKKMWHDGSTASQIADELGGVSRNAVIGKAHRLGLEARPSPVKAGEEKETPKKPAKAAAPKSARPAKVESSAAASHADDVAPGDAPTGAGPDLPPEPQRPRAPEPTMQYRSVGPGGFCGSYVGGRWRREPGGQATVADRARVAGPAALGGDGGR